MIQRNSGSDGWKKGVNLVQQMFITQQYRKDNGMNLVEEINNIEDDQLKRPPKEIQKGKKALKQN